MNNILRKVIVSAFLLVIGPLTLFAITNEDYVNYMVEQKMIYYKYADDAGKTEPAIEALNKKYNIDPGQLISYMSNADGEKYNKLQEMIEEKHQENVLKYLDEKASGSDQNKSEEGK